MSLKIAECKFTVGTPHEVVWNYIGKAIFRSFTMERVKIIDQNNFRALVWVKIGLFKLKMYLRGEITDIAAPQSFFAVINLKSRGGVIQLRQRVLFSLASINGVSTEVTCQVIIERMAPFFAKIFLGHARAVAEDTLYGIKTYLQQLS